MLLLYCIFLFVFCSYTSTAYSTVNKEGDINHDLHKNTELVEELLRQMKENDLRAKQFEVRMTGKFELMQNKLKEHEQENLRLRRVVSAATDHIGTMQVTLNQQEQDIHNVLIAASSCICKTDAEEDMDSKDGEETQTERTKKNADSVITRSGDIDKHVAFTALLSADAQHLGQFQNVEFDNVLVNDGNGYNPHDGVFVAPFTGTYVFSTTLTTKARYVSFYGFAKNGNIITDIYVDGHESWYESSSQTIVLQLQAGDDVSIRHKQSDKTLSGSNRSLFSGFLLYSSSSDASIIG